MKHTCEKTIWSEFSNHPHGVTAKHEHLGKWYCKIHHPPTVKAEDDERHRQWREEYKRKDAAKAAASAIRKAEQRVLKAASELAYFAETIRGRGALEFYEALGDLKALKAADRRAEMRELDERSPMPGGFPE
ncbi:hypothetical protein LCGC14_3108370 [marine sediment metagenome]|uniref:Uncharacterized protein n=1 Tax=marine sediment metagenome TaxID=412755 RepID=A0A0F8YVP5_9ZZZZ